MFAANHVYMTLKWDYYPELLANTTVSEFHVLFHLNIQTLILLWSGIKGFMKILTLEHSKMKYSDCPDVHSPVCKPAGKALEGQRC